MSEGMPQPNKRKFDKELEFNADRWERQAENRGIFSKEKTADDFMRAEAKRDDIDFEKKYIKESAKEYEVWEAHAQPVREAFLLQAESPEDVDFVTVNIFMQGGMRAAGIAGAALGQDMAGATSKTVNYAVGISSGATVAARFVGGREELLRGTAMLTGPLAKKEFISPRLGNTINLPYLKDLEENGEYAIDQQKVKDAHCKLWTIVTEPMKGAEGPRVRIIDSKTVEEGMTTATVSSMSIPQVTGKIPTLGGETFYDGGFAALPIKEIIEKVRSENPNKKVKVLIYTQASFDGMEDIKPASAETLGAKIMHGIATPLKGLGSLDPDTVRQLAKGLVLKENLRKSLEAIEKETDADIGVMWAPPTNLGMTSIDPDELKMAVNESARNAIKLFGAEQPEELPEYVPQRDQLKKAIEEYKQAKAA
ncbi:MAG: hypothetical protein JWM46_898 [Candidatus Kaiserbacteria bacterium]|nr:hypothetical protein [Candidatus Kaiserbacteria bacterium]